MLYNSTKLATKWLKDNRISVLDCPSQSPDLSHRENASGQSCEGVCACVGLCVWVCVCNKPVPPVLSGENGWKLLISSEKLGKKSNKQTKNTLKYFDI